MEKEKGEQLFKSFAYDYAADEREAAEREAERKRAEEDRAEKRKLAEEKARQVMARQKAVQEPETAVAYVPKFDPPEGMVVPRSQRHADIVEKTAIFLSKGDKQMEIVLRAKQGNNPLFDFLNPSDQLNPYYRHLRFLISSGLYAYSSRPEESTQKPEETKKKKKTRIERKLVKRTVKKKVPIVKPMIALAAALSLFFFFLLV